MPKDEYDAIIIGGGPDRLVTVAYLVKAGVFISLQENKKGEDDEADDKVGSQRRGI